MNLDDSDEGRMGGAEVHSRKLPDAWREMIDAHMAEKGVTVYRQGAVAIDAAETRPQATSRERKDAGARMYHRQQRFENLARREAEEREAEERARLARLGPPAPRPARIAPPPRPAPQDREAERAGAAAPPLAPGISAAPEPAEMGARPRLEWLPIAKLVVSEAYQRDLAERSRRMIRRGVGAFSWARFKALNVAARSDGFFEVLDGQHSAAILLTHGGCAEAPCLVVGDAAPEAKAEDFVALNTGRVQMTPMQRHHAAVAARDETALTVERAAARAGVRVRRGSGAYRPGDTVAVTALAAIARRRGEDGLVKIMRLCALAELTPIKTDALRAVELLQFEDEFRGAIGSGAIVAALADLPALTLEAAAERKVSGAPLYRQLAVTLFRKASSPGAFKESAGAVALFRRAAP